MIVYLAVLLLAAALIGFWVWMRYTEAEYLDDLAKAVRYDTSHADEWEQPRIVQGIYDGEDDFRD